MISAFALAQPLFDVLARTPDFFAVRGSTSSDIVLFAVGLTLLPTVVLALTELVAGLVHARVRRLLHLALVAALAALVALQLLKRVGEASSPIVISAALSSGVIFSFGYARTGVVRSFISVLAPAPLVFLLLFLFHSPVSKLVLAHDDTIEVRGGTSVKTPVIVVIFDEFPSISLMDERRQVDGVRYPNFSRLAGDSIWFRNASTVHDDTTKAVPVILTGNYPQSGQLPIASDHPRNLFSLFVRTHHMNVMEAVTHLCPDEVCQGVDDPFSARASSLASDLAIVLLHVLLPDDMSTRLPSVTETWMDFGRDETTPGKRVSDRDTRTREEELRDTVRREIRGDPAAQFDRFVELIARRDRHSLNFLHVMLPHSPWRYFPTGKRYGNGIVFGRVRGRWSSDERFATQAFQRHLLQVGFVDTLLGKLLARLRSENLYDDALIVVTADHGVSFRPGDLVRGVTRSNAHDIAAVPLFIKRPNQRDGEIVDHHIQTIDILPTVAEILGVSLPWDTDGQSAFEIGANGREEVIMFKRRFFGATSAGKRLRFDSELLDRREHAALARKVSIFGSGDPSLLFRLGPHSELIGRRANDSVVSAGSGLRVEIENEEELRSVDLRAQTVPALINGRVSGNKAREDLTFAISVNGRIAATTRTFSSRGEFRFSTLVPESVFRGGANEMEIFLVSASNGSLVLNRLQRLRT